MDDINEVVADIFGLKASQVDEKLTPGDVPAWDSLNHLRLVTAVEEELGVTFSMDEIQSIDSIGRLRQLIEQKTSAQ